MTEAPTLDRADVLGVLGGMGPLATADFLDKLVRATPAARDQDHIPTIVLSWPQIPDRVAPITEGRSPSPLPWLQAGARTLVAAGAKAIAIPCNAAHYWFDEVAASCPVPMLHIVDAVAAEAPSGPLGLVGTRAILQSRLYPERLGRPCIEPTEAELATDIVPGILGVKGGEVATWGPRFRVVVDRMLADGAAAVVLACTEIPAAIPSFDGCVDPTAALARRCVTWAMAQR